MRPAQPAALHRRFTPAPLALAAAMAIALLGHAPLARAQSDTATAASAPIAINIPAQPLGQALNELARQANLQMTFPAALVAGKQAPAVAGQLTVRQALDRLLTGRGLVATVEGSSVIVRTAPVRQSGDATLPAVTVTAPRAPLLGQPSAAYPGGQVARGGTLGILGDTDFMDAPFSQQSFTEELKNDRQARTLSDVLDSSPAIRPQSMRGDANESFVVRGFRAGDGLNILYDGFAGIMPGRRVFVEGIERTELLLGPSAMINGVTPFAVMGGTIGLVPKRAGTEPLTRVTASAASNANAGLAIDVSRRVGEYEALGIRVTAAHRSGNLALDRSSESNTVASLALDYAGERLRAFGTLVSVDNRFTNPQSYIYFSPGFALPDAPSNTNNFNIANGSSAFDHRLGTLRVEYDWSDGLTFFGGYGFGNYRFRDFGAFHELTSTAGDLAPYFYDFHQRNDSWTIEGGLRARFATGSIKHRLVVSASRLTLESSSESADSVGATSNVFNPVAQVFVPSGPRAPGFRQDQEFLGLSIADTMSFAGDRVLVTVGARHQNLRTVPRNPVTGAVNAASIYDESRVTPLMGVVVKPSIGLSLYGNYAEGMSQGGTAPITAANPNVTLPPLVTKQLELGVKRDYRDFAITAAVFQITRPSQFVDPATNLFGEYGEQRNRGLELSVFGKPLRGLRLLGGAAFTDAILTKTEDPALEGKRALGVPKYQFNLDAEMDVTQVAGLSVFGRVLHTSSARMDFNGIQSVPSWTRWDIGANYRFRTVGSNLVARFAVTNLFNRDYWIAGTDPHLLLSEPRSILLSLQADF